jgi:hypothetical protein
MADFDSPWKDALDDFLEAFLSLCFPLAHAGIDWSRGYEPFDKELQQIVRDAELGRRLVDKLFKVWRHDGSPAWVMIHIEVQGQEDPAFAERMYVYNYRLYDRYHVPILSLAVLADDNPNWRPNSFIIDLWGCRAGLEFPTVKLLDFANRLEDLETGENIFGIVLNAHLKAHETRRDAALRHTWKIRLVRGLYERGLSPEQVRRLFKIVDWLLELPEELEDGFLAQVAAIQESKKMPYVTSIERLGIRKGMLRSLELSLEQRFGAEGLKLAAEIPVIRDVGLLEDLQRALFTDATLDEWRQRLPKKN